MLYLSSKVSVFVAFRKAENLYARQSAWLSVQGRMRVDTLYLRVRSLDEQARQWTVLRVVDDREGLLSPCGRLTPMQIGDQARRRG